MKSAELDYENTADRNNLPQIQAETKTEKETNFAHLSLALAIFVTAHSIC